MASHGDAGDVVACRLADDTASAHVWRRVPRVAPGTTANEARTALIAEHYESVADIAVCRDDQLVGLVPLEVVPVSVGRNPDGVPHGS
jgi:hypothetical protein